MVDPQLCHYIQNVLFLRKNAWSGYHIALHTFLARIYIALMVLRQFEVIK